MFGNQKDGHLGTGKAMYIFQSWNKAMFMCSILQHLIIHSHGNYSSSSYPRFGRYNSEHDKYDSLFPWRLYSREEERKQRNKKPSK